MTRRDALTCLITCLLSAAVTGPLFSQDGNALVMEKATIRDPMASNQEAVSFLKPRGWTVEGGIKWYPHHYHQACLEIRVKAPTGFDQVETLPWAYFNWHTRPVIAMPVGYNYQGSIIHPVIEDPREAVRKFTIPSLRPGAVITAYQELPEVAKELSALNGGARVRAGRTRLEYTLNGQRVEEDIYLSIFVTSANIGGGNTSTIWGPAWTPFGLRAAKGQLDARTGLLLATMQSAQIHQGWFSEYMYVCKLFVDRQYRAIDDARRLSQQISQNSDYIRKLYSDAYWSRQASQDRISQNFSDYIRGVTRYQSPHSNYPVQLPSGYRNAWTSANGYYLLTNGEENPNVGSNQTWQRLQQAP